MTKIGNAWVRLLFLVSFFLSASALAQVKVEAIPDRDKIGEGDTVTISVSVISKDSAEAQDPRLPDLEGFELLNQWTNTSSSTRFSFENGKPVHTSETRTTYNYLLAAKKRGNFNIDSFEVVVGGTAYKTQPFKIDVGEAGSRPQNQARQQGRRLNLPGIDDEDEPPLGMTDDPEDLFNQLLKQREQLLKQFQGGGGGGFPGGFGMPANPPLNQKLPVNTEEAFFVWADVDKKEAYEGEQVTVSWYIYSRGQMETLDRLKFPDLRGFWKEIIEEVPALRFEDAVVNGVPFKRALLASHALFPIRAGVAVVDEFKIRSKLRLLGNFGFSSPTTYTKSSKRIEIKVKPLPTEGRPRNFSGAVGDFQVKVFTEARQVYMGQPFTLKVRFEGTGNAKLIDLPNLNLPASFETYDTKSDSRFFKDGTSYKEFDVVVVPKQVGTFTIEPIDFGMFNVAAKSYTSKHSEALTLEVLQGTAAQNSGDSRLQVDAKKKEEKLFVPQLVTTLSPSWWQTYASLRIPFYTTLLILVMILLGGKSIREFSNRDKKKSIKQNIAARFKKVEQSLRSKDKRQVGTEMTNLYYYVLGEVSGLGGATQEIRKLLDAAPASLRREFAEGITQNFEFFQLLTFAPEDVVNSQIDENRMQEQIKKATVLLHKIADSFDEIKKVSSSAT